MAMCPPSSWLPSSATPGSPKSRRNGFSIILPFVRPVQASIRRLSGDLFGAAAERFRVGLGARVDDRVIREVNAARYVGWQEQQLVLDLLRVQRLNDRDFAELH